MQKMIFVNKMAGIHIGGGERVHIEMARQALDHGYSVEFYTADGRERQKLIDELPNARTIFLPSIGLTQISHLMYQYLNVAFLRSIPRQLDDLIFAIMCLIKMRVQRKVGIFICHNIYLSFLCSIWNSNTILRFPGPATRILQRILASNARYTVCNGHAYQLNKLIHKNAQFLQIGVDNNDEFLRPIDERLGIGFVGRLVPIKGISTLVKLADAMSNYDVDNTDVVTVYGDGTMREEVKKARIKIMGNMDKQTLFNELSKNKILLNTSTYENYSNAIIEAISLGLFCVVNKVGGNELMAQKYPNLVHCIDMNDIDGTVTLIRDISEKVYCDQCESERKKVLREHNWKSAFKKLESLFNGT